MNIYSCVDNNNIDKIFVLYYSIYKNTKHFNKLNFYIITDKEITCEIPIFLKEQLQIKIIKFTDEWELILNNFNKYFYNRSDWCKSDLNFARFFIFDLFPELDRFIYLDWDMIVQKDIYELKEFYDKDMPIVAMLFNQWNIHRNIIDEKKKIDTTILKLAEEELGQRDILNYKSSYNSFNSGFYIVSKDDFILSKLSELINKLIKLQKEYQLFKFGTQVIMNLLFVNCKFIDYKWNTNQINEQSYIIHWCGHNKPWTTNDKIWESYRSKMLPSNIPSNVDNSDSLKLINKNVLILLKNKL